ncbi:MAG: hypothetical protein M5T61_13710 [Acidimicrobiia bacterium]|nr:hypothetical protein [Acidimicrobiia bacterium]
MQGDGAGPEVVTRSCCVWSPGWPVTAARRRDPGLRGVAVVVRERAGGRDAVRAASAEARRGGGGRDATQGGRGPLPGAGGGRRRPAW